MSHARQAIALQTLSMPDVEICADEALFLRRFGDVTVSGDVLEFGVGGRVSFDAWVNLFNLGNWQAHCALDSLFLRLVGQGTFNLSLSDMSTGKALLDTEVLLHPDGVELDLWPLIQTLSGAEILSVELISQSGGVLTHGAFSTATIPARTVRLAIGITTFRREQAVVQTAGRLREFFAGAGQAIAMSTHVFIIDNGQSVTIGSDRDITVIPNRNLGGAGGFTRALMQAEDGGFSHCLFMDDDASFPMENLIRTFAFLQLARSDGAALAGAMIAEGRPWEMWEYGAVFDRYCRPQFGHTDLRDRDEVSQMEVRATGQKPPGFYGGWWYFAFPVAQVKHYPFPFFVRGDDISFSLAHDFEMATLNGVMSFQEDFGQKESPQVLYLDMRSHLHHHLTHPHMEIGRISMLRVVWRLTLRSLLRMHYASAEAQLRGWEDVMQGPQHFEENVDMTAKRAEIALLGKSEAWSPSENINVPLLEPSSKFYGRVMWILLNGHIVPFWRMFAARIMVDISQRAPIWPLWGVARAKFVDSSDLDETRAYEVHHSKRQFYSIVWHATLLSWRWLRSYPELRNRYREEYERIATRRWWEAVFAEDKEAGLSSRKMP